VRFYRYDYLHQYWCQRLRISGTPTTSAGNSYNNPPQVVTAPCSAATISGNGYFMNAASTIVLI
jgi:hypothetical protein